MDDLRQAVLDAAPITPCHITGMHSPDHTVNGLCDDQKAAAFDLLLTSLGMTWTDLHRRLHDERCGWCHRVPAQEKHRERLRDLHRWAGEPISDELAAVAPDVPQPGDAEHVYAHLTDEFESWQVVVPRLRTDALPYFPNERYWAALKALGDRVQVVDISARRAPAAA